MAKSFISDSGSDYDSNDDYENGYEYGSPDEDPPTIEELNIKNAKKYYIKNLWYILIFTLIYNLLIIMLGNHHLNLYKIFDL